MPRLLLFLLAAATLAFRLPNEDGQTSQGAALTGGKRKRLYEEGWVTPREQGHLAYFDLHIPKCAGTSWAKDVAELLPAGEGYHTKEGCYYQKRAKEFLPGDRMVALLRQPAEHVLSQFLECKYARFGRENVRGEDGGALANITTWLRHFTLGGAEADDFRCYHPYNMQARAMSCASEANFASHHYTSTGEPSLERAVASARGAFFVGFVEHYQASLCLFLSKAKPGAKLPRYCDCRKKDWASFQGHNVTYKVPPHSLANLTTEDLQLVQELTRLDQAVYDAAWARFRKEANDLQKSSGVKVLCLPSQPSSGAAIAAVA